MAILSSSTPSRCANPPSETRLTVSRGRARKIERLTPGDSERRPTDRHKARSPGAAPMTISFKLLIVILLLSAFGPQSVDGIAAPASPSAHAFVPTESSEVFSPGSMDATTRDLVKEAYAAVAQHNLSSAIEKMQTAVNRLVQQHSTNFGKRCLKINPI